LANLTIAHTPQWRPSW